MPGRGWTPTRRRRPFRAWLYGIATHACLDALRRRKSRIWPTDVAGPAIPQRYELGAVDLPWLQPYPDRLLDLAAEADSEPEAVVTARETIELAFLAAIQRLPARQRAVLDPARHPGLVGQGHRHGIVVTPAAVNSALQRAHATLADHLTSAARELADARPAAPGERRAVQRLVAAWEQADPSDLVDLLADDVKLIMPPGAVWFGGRADVLSFLAEHVFRDMGMRWRTRPRRPTANPRSPSTGNARSTGPFEAFAIVVLTVVGDEITEIALFQQPELFGSFDLPATA